MNRNNPYHSPEGAVSEGALRRRIFFINLFCILIAIGLSLWFLIALRVETVTVEGVREITETDVLDAANIKKGKHLFAISEKKIEKTVSSLSPYVESVTVTRFFPSTITVTVNEHKPLYRAEKDGTWYLLSRDLTVLEITVDEVFASAKAPCLLTLPTIKEGTLGSALTLLDTAEDSRVKALLSVFAKYSLTDQLTELNVRKSRDITAVVSGQYTICFGDDDEMSKKLKLCQKAVRYLGENMGRVAGILYAWTPEEVSFVMTGVAN